MNEVVLPSRFFIALSSAGRCWRVIEEWIHPGSPANKWNFFYSFFEHRLSHKIVVKSGQESDNVQRAIYFIQWNVDTRPILAKTVS